MLRSFVDCFFNKANNNSKPFMSGLQHKYFVYFCYVLLFITSLLSPLLSQLDFFQIDYDHYNTSNIINYENAFICTQLNLYKLKFLSQKLQFYIIILHKSKSVVVTVRPFKFLMIIPGDYFKCATIKNSLVIKFTEKCKWVISSNVYPTYCKNMKLDL